MLCKSQLFQSKVVRHDDFPIDPVTFIFIFPFYFPTMLGCAYPIKYCEKDVADMHRPSLQKKNTFITIYLDQKQRSLYTSRFGGRGEHYKQTKYTLKTKFAEQYHPSPLLISKTSHVPSEKQRETMKFECGQAV